MVAAVLEAYDRCDTLDSIEGGAEFKAWLKAGVVNGFGIGASTGLLRGALRATVVFF